MRNGLEALNSKFPCHAKLIGGVNFADDIIHLF